MNERRDSVLVDTHVHLDDPAFDSDRAQVLAAARSAGVVHLLNVGYSPDRWPTTVALSTAQPDVSAILGLHPQQADRFDASLLDALEGLLKASGAKAVGEIGLDLSRTDADVAIQRRAFIAQIDLAAKLGLPVVIHQRAAEDHLIDVLKAAPDLPAVILHSFDGSSRLAQFARHRGFVIGVGGLATRPARQDLRDVLATIPIDRLVLETDAPYLVPAGRKGRRNEPAFVVEVAQQVAPIWGVTPDELAATTTQTARRVFRLASICPSSTDPIR